MENRLSALKTRDSTLGSQNEQLKHEINVLRSERVLSHQIHEKHKKVLREQQRQMAAVFEHSGELMAERDHFLSAMQCLSDTNENERSDFDVAYARLTNIILTESRNAEAYRKEAIAMNPDKGKALMKPS